MELTRIEIESYKSIKKPVTIFFSKDHPTILIGKNGSGKTTVLEALAIIAEANSNYNNALISKHNTPTYRAYLELSKEDWESILPNVAYDSEKCELYVYSRNGDIKIDSIVSEYIVPYLKKEITDVQELATQMEKAIDEYELQLKRISHGGDGEIPINCYELRNENGGLTNYNIIVNQAEWFIKDSRDALNQLLRSFDDCELLFLHKTNYLFLRDSPKAFRLEYMEPHLAAFEQKFVTINRKAIKREITRINKATKEAAEKIEELIAEIAERRDRIEEGVYAGLAEMREEKYYAFLARIRRIIGNKCLFLKNEGSRDLIFKKKEQNDYHFNNPTSWIVETYIKKVYNGSDKEDLLKSMNGRTTLSPQAATEFEMFVNKNIPEFEKGMYDSVSVNVDDNGQLSILLNEKTGSQINLNETSTGRRWYFTYYLMKNILEKGDIFIIDEPAQILHPSAQREVLKDLIELTNRGIRVIYSTHSPYLIPGERKNIHFVTMTEKGTKVERFLSNKQLVYQMRQIVGNDIFDIQNILEEYFLNTPENIAKNVSDLIRSTQKERGIKNLQIACDEIGIKYDTMKSWNYIPVGQNGKKSRKYCSPSPENVIKVLQWAKKA